MFRVPSYKVPRYQSFTFTVVWPATSTPTKASRDKTDESRNLRRGLHLGSGIFCNNKFSNWAFLEGLHKIPKKNKDLQVTFLLGGGNSNIFWNVHRYLGK